MGDGFVDVHNHSLFGVDDGAPTIEDSINMIKKAVSDGITTIVLTPHCYGGRRHVDSSLIVKNFDTLCDRVREEQIRVNLYLGNEIMYGENTLDLLSIREAFTYPNSKFILVEFYPDSPDSVIVNAVKNLKGAGYIPVLAHVERYHFIVEDINNIKLLRNLGAYIAVNADTLKMGIFSKPKKLATKLLKLNYVDFITTDAHDIKDYPPLLNKAYETVAKLTNRDYANKIFKTNATLLINNK